MVVDVDDVVVVCATVVVEDCAIDVVEVVVVEARHA